MNHHSSKQRHRGRGRPWQSEFRSVVAKRERIVQTATGDPENGLPDGLLLAAIHEKRLRQSGLMQEYIVERYRCDEGKLLADTLHCQIPD